MSTFEHDGSLPRVPLPSLAESAERFLDWCRPLLSAAELAETEQAVADLLAPHSPAYALQQALVDVDDAHPAGSWLDDFWPARYLGRRDRIALNANFAFLFADDVPLLAGISGRSERAAALLVAAVDYLVQLQREEIAPVLHRGRPLSMEQNRYLFSSARIPGTEQDAVRTAYSTEHPGPPTARHVVVLRGGQAHLLDVLAPDGTPYALGDLAAALDAVPAGAGEPAAGHLTTQARARWAANRTALAALAPTNAAALEAIDSALLVLCLDDDSPADAPAAARQLLAGSHGNRWYDKGVSLIVCADGTAGINVEHCWLDGTTILSFVDALLSRTVAEHAATSGARTQKAPLAQPMPFVLDDRLQDEVADAADEFADYADSAATMLIRHGVGADRIKALGVSPDAFCQLAYQLAHRRARGTTGATYESIATRHWRRGRTEAMRVVTPQMLGFVAALCDDESDTATRRDAARAAAEAHVQRAQDCQAGRAPEQHLWELELIGRRDGAALGVSELPALFGSPGWRILRTDYLSTSSAPSPNIVCFAFGSTSETCIGVAYVLLADRLSVHLCAPVTQAAGLERFGTELTRALDELVDLLAD